MSEGRRGEETRGYLGGVLGAGRVPGRPLTCAGAAAPRTPGSSGRPPPPATGGSGPDQGPGMWGRGAAAGLALAPGFAHASRLGGPSCDEFQFRGPAPDGRGPGARGEVAEGGWRGS